MAERETIRAKGKKPVSFSKGGLHRSTHTPEGERISASKMAAAKRRDYDAKAKKQANFAIGMLAAGRRTARKNARRGARRGESAMPRPDRRRGRPSGWRNVLRSTKETRWRSRRWR
jgi:hypothetical protein